MVMLYRPVGLYELAAIIAADFAAFPPRLPEQPIFYPVLSEGYAVEIASRWNPPDPNSGFAGFVTAFSVPNETAARYPTQTVGAKRHQELWVPAAEQTVLEADFLSPIAVVAAYVGARLAEALPTWRGAVGEVPAESLGSLIAQVRAGPLHGGPLTEG